MIIISAQPSSVPVVTCGLWLFFKSLIKPNVKDLGFLSGQGPGPGTPCEAADLL